MNDLKRAEVAAFNAYVNTRRIKGSNHPETQAAKAKYHALEDELERAWGAR